MKKAIDLTLILVSIVAFGVIMYGLGRDRHSSVVRGEFSSVDLDLNVLREQNDLLSKEKTNLQVRIDILVAQVDSLKRRSDNQSEKSIKKIEVLTKTLKDGSLKVESILGLVTQVSGLSLEIQALNNSIRNVNRELSLLRAEVAGISVLVENLNGNFKELLSEIRRDTLNVQGRVDVILNRYASWNSNFDMLVKKTRGVAVPDPLGAVPFDLRVVSNLEKEVLELNAEFAKAQRWQ